ncbi:MAG: HD domain-containing phosphohydrolase [Deltaproteobacteria bacterium]
MEHTVLFVDDERNILNSMQRVFRKEGYNVLTAESGAQGLEAIRDKRVSLVVSDHRMPLMDGVEFLSKVKDASPYTVRIILTGYADLKSIMAAVNSGEVFRYITKPWDDDELKAVVRGAIDHYAVVAENLILQELTKRQNSELKQMNRSLEAKVLEKTKKIRDNFFAFVRICANLLELYEPYLGSHSKRIASMAKGLSSRMGLSGAEAELIESAALLHNIGLIGVPREILEKDPALLIEGEKAVLRHNPVLSQDILSQIDTLRQVGIIIRSHTERYDGGGHPDGLRKEEIHIGSRIIAVCKAYDGLRHRKKGPLGLTEALDAIYKEKALGLDPEVVDAFAGFIKDWKDEAMYPSVVMQGADMPYMRVSITDLIPGMRLVNDIVTVKGRHLVTKGTALSAALIEKVQKFHHIDAVAEGIEVLSNDMQDR